MKTPWLSVILPTHNGMQYLRATLDSIVIQDDKNIECIAIDDTSTDETCSILEEYASRLELSIHHTKNGNWVANTNQAVSFARGEYICFLHQDDIWFRDRLAIIKKIAQEFQEVDMIIHPSLFISSTGEILGSWNCPLPPYPQKVKSALLMERLLIQNFISIPGTIFKRKTMIDIGGMDERLWYTADWDLWLKLAAKTDAVYYPIPLSGFRIHGNSQTIQRSDNNNDFQEQMTFVLNRHLQSLDLEGSKKLQVWNIAQFSIEVNTKLAMLFHGKKINYFEMIFSFIKLGPSGWFQYFRDSRIFERIISRVKAEKLYKVENK